MSTRFRPSAALAAKDAEIASLRSHLSKARAALAEAERKWGESIPKLRAAEALADEVVVLVRRHVIDARSPAGDALLDFRDPPPTERADRLFALEASLASTQRQLERFAEEALAGLAGVVCTPIEGYLKAQVCFSSDLDAMRKLALRTVEAERQLEEARRAVEAEREACAQLVEDGACAEWCQHSECNDDKEKAAAIRARGQASEGQTTEGGK